MNMRPFEESFQWLRTGGLRLAIIVAGSLVLAHLLKLASDRVVRAVADGGAGQASEQEKRALTLAGIVKTVGTTVVVIPYPTQVHLTRIESLPPEEQP